MWRASWTRAGLEKLSGSFSRSCSAALRSRRAASSGVLAAGHFVPGVLEGGEFVAKEQEKQTDGGGGRLGERERNRARRSACRVPIDGGGMAGAN